MKKIIAVLFVVIVVAIIVITVNIRTDQKKKLEIQAFNEPYEYYDSDNLNGLDVITVINKAINNNEKNNIVKDEKGKYVDDGENSIRVFVTIGEETYNMEKISELGIESFITYFGTDSFKCEEIKYHEDSGKVSEITFKSNDK